MELAIVGPSLNLVAFFGDFFIIPRQYVLDLDLPVQPVSSTESLLPGQEHNWPGRHLFQLLRESEFADENWLTDLHESTLGTVVMLGNLFDSVL